MTKVFCSIGSRFDPRIAIVASEAETEPNKSGKSEKLVRQNRFRRADQSDSQKRERLVLKLCLRKKKVICHEWAEQNKSYCNIYSRRKYLGTVCNKYQLKAVQWWATSIVRLQSSLLLLLLLL